MENVMCYRNVHSTGAANVADSTVFLLPNCAGFLYWKSPNTAILPTSRHDYYILYVTEGSMQVLSGKYRETVCAGQFVCFYAESVYQYETFGEGVKYYYVHFTGHSVSELLERCGIKNQKVYTAGEIPEVYSAWQMLISEFSRQDYLFSVRSSAKLLDILTFLSECIDMSGEALASKKLRRSIDYIHESFNKDISVTELAELEHLSSSRYYTLFKECTGYAPTEYVIVLRMNRACTLMLQGDMTIKEVAAQVGYHDPFYFSRIFKKYMGMSPMEYKSENHRK